MGGIYGQRQRKESGRGDSRAKPWRKESQSVCEKESEWHLAGAWVHRGIWREMAGRENQTVQNTEGSKRQSEGIRSP